MGGFQEVATLLNCLGGPHSIDPPSLHENQDISAKKTRNLHVTCPKTTSDKQISNDANSLGTQQSKSNVKPQTKNTPKKNIRISVSKTDTLETGIHNGNIYLDSRLCPAFINKSNSLPRSKMPTVFINLQNESPDAGCTTHGTWHYSLKKKTPLSIASTFPADTRADLNRWCSHRPTPDSNDQIPSILTSHGVCQSCITVSLQCDSKMAHLHGIPRRSLSASTVSYLTDKESRAISHKERTQCAHQKCLHGCYSQSSQRPTYPRIAAEPSACSCAPSQGSTFSSVRPKDDKKTQTCQQGKC